MKPYYEDGSVTIYHGDCRDIMPELDPDGFDLVFADPPYGVQKAEWDATFDTDWMEAAARLAPVLAVTPGVWNLMAMPTVIGSLHYRWTLSAHLANGTGRGRLGLSLWIPCVIYSRPEDIDWTLPFADWCQSVGITRDALDAATETSDMAGWWMSRLPHRAQVPSADKWAMIRAAFNPPHAFDELVYADNPADPGWDSATFTLGAEPKADHPSPKPLTVMRWFLSRIPGYRLPRRGVLDPFMGSGTTLRAAKDMGRRAVGIEIDEAHCETAARRCSQEVLGLSEGVA